MQFRTFEPFIILIAKHYHTIKQSYYKILQTYCFYTKKINTNELPLKSKTIPTTR